MNQLLVLPGRERCNLSHFNKTKFFIIVKFLPTRLDPNVRLV
jgi:hypothetical protein